MFEREELLIGKEGLSNLKNKTILVLGIGGVGGYVVESLVRAGIGHLILCDYDIVDVTNINRQIIALHSNIGKKKTVCFKERIKDINPDCIVDVYDLFYDNENSDIFFSQKIDYIVDCCDTVKSKVLIIEESLKRNIPIISSMGTGNKIHPEMFKIEKLKHTSYDPLAKKMRYMLKDNKEALNIYVSYSTEESVKGLDKIGSMSFVPSSVGLLISSHVINTLLMEKEMNNIKLNVVPTNISKIKDNSVWCPTFQLIWNDLKNQIIGDNIFFINDENNLYANELNKESFNEKMINNDYYYKNFDYMTLDFKEKIKKDIKDKFNETSDILDRFNFTDNNRDYFFYSMLVRNFKFKYPFDILSNKTFGIKENSDDKLDDNVKVLFCDNDSYAVKLLTEDGDEVILYKGDLGNSFSETYQIIKNKSKEENFNKDDTITISNLNFKTEVKYEEVTNKTFYDINGVSYVISDTLQTILFKLDNIGGKVKSEAGMSVKFTSLIHGRHFDFNNNFVFFLKEESKEEPYFAINVSDINEFYD